MDRIIKGQAWITEEEVSENVKIQKLVQEQITFSTDTNRETCKVIVLVEDIWADLVSETGTYKVNSKGDYFYWEYQMTDTETGNDITIKYTCPKPKYGLIVEPYNPSVISDDKKYLKYWTEKYKIAKENADREMPIQRKEVVFPGSSCVDQNGDVINYPDFTFRNNDIGDITNLLSMF